VPAPLPRQRVIRVTYLANQWRDSPEYAQEFVRNLDDLGWRDGRNLTIDWRFTDATEPWLPDLAADIVRLAPDLIVTDHTLSALAVKQLTTSIPIVNTAGDPVGVGLVTSLARPGGNVTGLSTAVPQLVANVCKC
jgi:putative ABC transport system substrate-binding protein